MNTKKQYTTPTLVVVDVELQLMTGISGTDMTDEKSIQWSDNDSDAASAQDAW